MPALDYPALTGSLAFPTHIRRCLFDRYWSLVRYLRVRNLVAYWPLWEPEGSVAYGYSFNRCNGAYVNWYPGFAGIGDGHQSHAPPFVNGYINVYSIVLASKFNGREGTFAFWAKASGPGVWTDGANHNMYSLYCDIDNEMRIYKYTTGTLYWEYHAGGVAKSRSFLINPTSWFHVATTWSLSSDRALIYINAVQQGAALTGLGTWVGTLSSVNSVLGAYDTVPNQVWPGYLAHAALWNAALTPNEIARLYRG